VLQIKTCALNISLINVCILIYTDIKLSLMCEFLMVLLNLTEICFYDQMWLIFRFKISRMRL